MTRLPDERVTEQAVRSWMRDDDEHPADRNRQVGRIMGRVDETRQRRGAWRFLPFWHRSRPDDDDDLHPARRSGLAPSFMALAAVLALVLTSLGFLALRPSELPLTPGTSPSPSASPSPTIDPADQALLDRFERVWSGERTRLSDVLEVYAEDAVHTSMWHDKVERFIGASEIWQRIQTSGNVDAGDWTLLPDAANGAHRYLGVSRNLAGIPCVLWIQDSRITRHDCILPAASTSAYPLDFLTASPEALALWDEIGEDFGLGWANADRGMIERTTSPEIVHHVAMDNHAYTLSGIDQYLDIMGAGAIEELAPPIALPAPEGETRWTDFGSVGGGTLCTFWARDGLIVRHDCIVPTSMVSQPVPPTPEPSPGP